MSSLALNLKFINVISTFRETLARLSLLICLFCLNLSFTSILVSWWHTPDVQHMCSHLFTGQEITFSDIYSLHILQTVCLLGVVDKYKELAKYNLRQLTSKN